MNDPNPPCQVHRSHRPTPVVTHSHHIWPKALGGPTEPGNLVDICPTGHANAHAALHALMLGHPVPKVGRAELELARQGYAAWVRAGKPVAVGAKVPEIPAGQLDSGTAPAVP